MGAFPRRPLRPRGLTGLEMICVDGGQGLLAALPGFRISAAIAIVLLVAAEMIGAEFGVGAYVLLAGSLMATDELVAGVAILSVMGLSVNWLIARAERVLLKWRT